mmetsp:Transcript_98525/g.278611  ORF Transcript_98525/g.278611 Transcript_98525/m.278611 type:complete len:243 (+) Transcript_98525:893-1621(+)
MPESDRLPALAPAAPQQLAKELRHSWTTRRQSFDGGLKRVVSSRQAIQGNPRGLADEALFHNNAPSRQPGHCSRFPPNSDDPRTPSKLCPRPQSLATLVCSPPTAPQRQGLPGDAAPISFSQEWTKLSQMPRLLPLLPPRAKRPTACGRRPMHPRELPLERGLPRGVEPFLPREDREAEVGNTGGGLNATAPPARLHLRQPSCEVVAEGTWRSKTIPNDAQPRHAPDHKGVLEEVHRVPTAR